MQVHTEVDPITRVAYMLEIEPEDVPVRGNAMASGDDAVDRQVEDEIIERLDNGDLWAWCHVRVTASRGGYEGIDQLGCCNYCDTAQFMDPNGYYPGMKAAAYRRLLEAEQEVSD